MENGKINIGDDTFWDDIKDNNYLYQSTNYDMYYVSPYKLKVINKIKKYEQSLIDNENQECTFRPKINKKCKIKKNSHFTFDNYTLSSYNRKKKVIKKNNSVEKEEKFNFNPKINKNNLNPVFNNNHKHNFQEKKDTNYLLLFKKKCEIKNKNKKNNSCDMKDMKIVEQPLTLCEIKNSLHSQLQNIDSNSDDNDDCNKKTKNEIKTNFLKFNYKNYLNKIPKLKDNKIIIKKNTFNQNGIKKKGDGRKIFDNFS